MTAWNQSKRAAWQKRRPIAKASFYLAIAMVLFASMITSSGLARAAAGNLALNRPATASSVETGTSLTAGKACDGSTSTRWASVEPAPNAEWIYVDLGATYTINRVVLNWEAAYAKSYQIQTSNNASSWSTIYATTTGDGGIDTLTVSGSGRYVRVYMTVRGTSYGYSLWEFEVYGPGGVTPTTPPTTHPANELFDDFSYSGPSDGNLTNFGWVVRVATNEGPGPEGADWISSNISFVNDPSGGSNKLMQLRATTSGTGDSTKQAEIYRGARKFLEGTYAARVRFTDTPFSGSYDGDEINQTFFTITPLNYNMDPNYSENDFEYLPNGGWGASGPTMWLTTWETYQPEPWIQDSTSTQRSGSLSGWHNLLMVVSGGHVKYYIDNVLVADHSGKYYPETMMSINFNIWFIADNFGGSSSSRTWLEEVDWVYHARNTVLTQTQVNTLVTDFRNQATTRKNSMP